MARKLLKDMTEEELRQYYYNKEIEAERRGKIQAEVMKQRQEEKREEIRKELEEHWKKKDEEFEKMKQTPEYQERKRWETIGNVLFIIIILGLFVPMFGRGCTKNEIVNETLDVIGTIFWSGLIIASLVCIPITFIIAIFGNRDDNSRR